MEKLILGFCCSSNVPIQHEPEGIIADKSLFFEIDQMDRLYFPVKPQQLRAAGNGFHLDQLNDSLESSSKLSFFDKKCATISYTSQKPITNVTKQCNGSPSSNHKKIILLKTLQLKKIMEVLPNQAGQIFMLSGGQMLKIITNINSTVLISLTKFFIQLMSFQSRNYFYFIFVILKKQPTTKKKYYIQKPKQMNTSFSYNQNSEVNQDSYAYQTPNTPQNFQEILRSDSPIFGHSSQGNYQSNNRHAIMVEDEAAPTESNNQEHALWRQAFAEDNPTGQLLAQKLLETNELLTKQDEDFKAQMMQTETASMMAKYQLVFLKLETALVKTSTIFHYKRSFELKHSFSQLKCYSQVQDMNFNQSAHKVVLMIRKSIQNIFDFAEKLKKKQLSYSIQRMRTKTLAISIKAKIKKDIEATVNEYKDLIILRDKEVKDLMFKLEDLINQLDALKSKESDYLNKLKARDKKILSLEGEAVSKSQVSGTSNQQNTKKVEESPELNNLRGQLKDLEKKNKELKEKIVATEGNVTVFIREMSDLLEAHEANIQDRSMEDHNLSLNSSNRGSEGNDRSDPMLLEDKTKQSKPRTNAANIKNTVNPQQSVSNVNSNQNAPKNISGVGYQLLKMNSSTSRGVTQNIQKHKLFNI